MLLLGVLFQQKSAFFKNVAPLPAKELRRPWLLQRIVTFGPQLNGDPNSKCQEVNSKFYVKIKVKTKKRFSPWFLQTQSTTFS